MRQRPGAVAQVEPLAGTDPSDIGGVEALVTVDDRDLTDIRQRVDVEDGAVDRAMRVQRRSPKIIGQ